MRHAFSRSLLRPRGIFIFEALTTKRAHSGRSLNLYLYMKTIRAAQAKVHMACFVQSDPTRNNCKTLILSKLFHNVQNCGEQVNFVLKSTIQNMTFDLDLVHSILGRICCPEGKGTTGLQGPLQGAPPHLTPHLHTKDSHSTGITLLTYILYNV